MSVVSVPHDDDVSDDDDEEEEVAEEEEDVSIIDLTGGDDNSITNSVTVEPVQPSVPSFLNVPRVQRQPVLGGIFTSLDLFVV